MKKNNLKKGFVLPLVIAIVAILAIGGTVYLTTDKKVEAPLVIESNVPKQNTQATTTAANNFESKRIIVVSPKEGDKLENGQNFLLKWRNVSGQEALNVALVSSTSSKIIAQVSPSSVEYNWTVSDLDTNSKYRIEVYSTGSRELVGRSGYFSVISPVACTMDAMMCPDGTYVGRSGPKCEFVCPISDLLKICPDSKFTNKMPGPGTGTPSSYYILDGKRRELTEFDQNWVAANCVVKEYSAY